MQKPDWLKIKEVFNHTLDLPEPERESYLAACGEQVRLEVAKLLDSDRTVGDFISEPAVVEFGLNEDKLIGGQIGDYKIIKQIGAGGMGKVYLAEREDLEQKFALKIIKRGMDTDAVLKRFVRERQILSRLEHPNIAHLRDVGSTEAGLPYFVMEYVEGDTITKFCESHQFDKRERLELFRQVCSAVSYSHQNLIIHRDLKPSNILVTSVGTPKLLDFGIAKLLDSDGFEITATATQHRIFTPEYASPEQLNGLPITTSTDVYSLGVVLYELLSGDRPFKSKSKNYAEIANMVLTQEPIRPSSVVSGAERWSVAGDTDEDNVETQNENNPKSKTQNPKSLRGDVDNIILKSLRKEPERRYQSVQEFSEDIRRYLNGLPVTATADTTVYRLSKFIKRNKIGTVIAALILILSGISIWQTVVATRERAKAEQRFEQVRKLANIVLFDIHDSIQNLQGATAARELILNSSLEYLDKLAAESDTDNTLQMELATAYDRVGDVQGGIWQANLGQIENAEESYRKAIVIKEKLIASEQWNFDFRRKLAESYMKIAQLFSKQLDFDKSLEYFGKALENNKTLAELFPNDNKIQFDYAMNQANYARSLALKARIDESLEYARNAVSISEQMSRAEPENIEFKTGLSFCYARLAEILSGAKSEYTEAIMLLTKSTTLREYVFHSDPTNTKFKRDLAAGYYDIADTSMASGDSKNAIPFAQKSLTLFLELSKDDPKNEHTKEAINAVRIELCKAQIKNGNAKIANRMMIETVLSLEKTFASSPTDGQIRFRIASAYHVLGESYLAIANSESSVQTQLKNLQEARTRFQTAYEIFKSFDDAGKLIGDDAKYVTNAKQGIDDCEKAIAKLKGNSKDS